MNFLTFISKGIAILTADGLRCAALRQDDSSRRCNRLLAKKNEQRQIAGNFRCDRCGQEIEVRLGPPPKLEKSDAPVPGAPRSRNAIDHRVGN